jgi:hypothetical protein
MAGLGGSCGLLRQSRWCGPAWAEWVAWQLTDAGYTIELAEWDWAPGQNFMLAMSDALTRCDRVEALFSAAYFDRDRYTTEERTASLVHQPGPGQGRLVPVRVEDVSELHKVASRCLKRRRRPPPSS